MSKLDDIFEANTRAVTKYHDSDGDEVTDFDTVLLDTYTAKQQIKDLFSDIITNGVTIEAFCIGYCDYGHVDGCPVPKIVEYSSKLFQKVEEL